MNCSTEIKQLEQVQDSIRNIGAVLDEGDYRQQYHTDLSALGWHIGHCSFIETYWLREIVMQDDSLTGELHNLYFPENMPKPERGPALPEISEHLDWCKQRNEETRNILAEPPALLRRHKLGQDDYLGKFILQHHAQHLETIYMVLQQRAIRLGAQQYEAGMPLIAAACGVDTVVLPAGRYRIGSEHTAEAFDNEVPPHHTDLARVNIARRPVSNSLWLAFMQDNGYQQKQWWSEAGWQWRQDGNIDCPEHWQRDRQGNWFGLDHTGPHDLPADGPVYGVNYYEARAFVNWFNSSNTPGARLLHEYEWEAAAKEGLLKDTGQVWEWCNNTFHPYEGFTAFPYDNYSKAWFDDKHFVLRGGSRQSCDVIKRHSFRNFYNPDKRHIFAGLRIAID